MTISANKVSNFNNDIKTKRNDTKKNSKDSFSDIMNLASVGSDSSFDYKMGSDTELKKENSITARKNDNVLEKKSYSEAADRKSAVNKYDKVKNQESNQINDDLEKEIVLLSNNQKSEIISLMDEILALLSSELGLTEEEINSELSEMGISLDDLLDQSILKDFVLFVNGSSDVDLLIDENLSLQLTELSGMMSEFTEKLSEIFGEQDLDTVSKLLKVFLNNETDESLRQIWNLTAKSSTEEVVESGDSIFAEKVTIDAKHDDITYENGDEPANLSKDDSLNMAEQFFEDKTDSLEVNFSQAISKAFDDLNIDGMSDLDGVDNVRQIVDDIVRQIVDEIEAHVTKDTRSLEVQLNPENLGKVTIVVSEREGAMQARIIAENEAAKNAIEAGLSNLKEALDNNELKVEAIEVMVGTYEANAQGEEQQKNEDSNAAASKNLSINLDELDGEDEISEQERLQIEMMRMAGNRVNYSI